MSNNQPKDCLVEDRLQNTELLKTFDSLVLKSQETLESILNNKDVSTVEKADVALRILQIAANRDREYSSSLANKKELKTQPLTIVNPERENVRSITTAKSELFNSESKFFPAQYWQIDNFLSPQEYEKVLNTALNKRQEFKDSQTVNKKDRYRQSSVLPGKYFSDVYYSVKSKLLNTLPSVLSNLEHSEFFVSHVEMQMTAHNDGCFYKTHSDAGSAKTKTRELTYVYYFYKEPKAFTGGELKLYDTEMLGKKFIQHDNSKIVEPRNNSIVFFNSRCKHEVLPIQCNSRQFEDSRFTLNGWLRR